MKDAQDWCKARGIATGSTAGNAATTVTNVARGVGGARVIVSLVLIAAILLGGFLALNAAYTEYMRITGQLEIRKAEAETEKLQAQVDLESAAADRARAEGERIAAEGDRAQAIAIGEAIKAPSEAAARTVDRQSAVMTFWGFITPGLFISLMLVSSCLGGVGGPFVLLLLFTAFKRYAPEFSEAWNKAKADYEVRKNADAETD